MKPVAAKGAIVTATDTHIILVPGPGGATPTPMALPFCGPLVDDLSPDVLVEHKAVAVVGSVAENIPLHVAPAGSFQSPPSNKGVLHTGSGTVLVNNKPIARDGDVASTCNDPADLPIGSVKASGTVLAG